MVSPRPAGGAPDDRPKGRNRPLANQDADDEKLVELNEARDFLEAISVDDDPEAPAAPDARSAHAGASSQVPPPPPPTPSQSASPGMPRPTDEPARRDRIVVLGRRASGKTVYLARLYGQLFRGAGALSAEALDGRSHLRCTQALDALSRGQWPAATGDTAVIDIALRFPGGMERLVMLDYPGEVFRRAFVEESGGPDVAVLVEHVDRAAAVMLLIDPGSTVGMWAVENAENDFGMIQALRRIRSTPSGRRVPIAVVLTKVDAHAARIRAAGGLKPFVEKALPALARVAAGARVFGCAAVQTTVDPMGRRLPQIRTDPVGLIEPLAWCLRSLGSLRASEFETQRRRELEELARLEQAADAEAAAGERKILVAVWILAAVLVALGAFVIVFLLGDGAKP